MATFAYDGRWFIFVVDFAIIIPQCHLDTISIISDGT
jgi:hypothetical protein